MYAPVSGEVVEINTKLKDESAKARARRLLRRLAPPRPGGTRGAGARASCFFPEQPARPPPKLFLFPSACSPQLNSAPFTDGWMIKVKLSAKDKDVKDLMDAAAYEKHCAH